MIENYGKKSDEANTLPSLPGCEARGSGPQKTIEHVAKAVDMRVMGLEEDGFSIRAVAGSEALRVHRSKAGLLN